MLHTFQKNNSSAIKCEVLSSSLSTGVGARNSWILILPLKPIPSVILSKSLNLLPSVSPSRTGIMLLTYQTFLLGMFWRSVFAECFEDEITTQKLEVALAGPRAAVNRYSSLRQNSPWSHGELYLCKDHRFRSSSLTVKAFSDFSFTFHLLLHI